MLSEIDTSSLVFKVFIALVVNLVLALVVMGYARAEDKARFVRRWCALSLLVVSSFGLYFSLVRPAASDVHTTASVTR